MRITMLTTLAAAVALTGCSDYYGNSRPGYNSGYNSGYGSGWDPVRNYRTGDRYRDRQLSRDDRIYRGSDGRYYCRRDDGTAGLVVGGIAGGALGALIAPGGSEVIGALLGAGAGALVGREVDRSGGDNEAPICR